MSLTRTNHVHINNMIDEFEAEKSKPFRQIHRMIDLFETIIKTHTSFIVGLYFKEKNIENSIKKMFANELRSPSLGKWQEFSRKLIYEIIIRKRLSESEFETMIKVLSSKKSNSLLNEFKKSYKKINGTYELVDKKSLNYKVVKKIWRQNYEIISNPMIIDNYIKEFDLFNRKYADDIIELRNKYAHGATPSDSNCKQDIENFYDKLEILLNSNLFQSTTIATYSEEINEFISFESKDFLKEFSSNQDSLYLNFSDEKVSKRQLFIIGKYGKVVCLFPMMIIEEINDNKIDSLKIVFFNDMKRFEKHQEITYLNYPKAIRINDKDMNKDFLRITGLNEIKSSSKLEFQNIIDNKTESFFGRENTIYKLKNKIESTDNQYFMIFGAPGIGKSALSANLCKEFINYKLNNEINVIEYFFRKGSQFSNSETFLNEMFKKIDFIMKNEKHKNFKYTQMSLNNKLIELSYYLTDKNEKAIFIIDGIDEAANSINSNYLPNESYKNIYFIYTARENIKTTELWSRLDRENRTKIRLEPLSSGDIRSVLYETVNKYYVIDNPNFIKIVAEKSGGNPLYLKMLCDSIYSGDIDFKGECLEKLPKGIKDFYKDWINKINKNNNSQLIKNILQLLSIAKEPLTVSQIEVILGGSKKCINKEELNETNIDKCLHFILDYLNVHQEYASTIEDAYSLFHESLREYITKRYENQIIDSKELIQQYFSKWEDLGKYSKNIYQYPLKYYSTFLYDEKRFKELCSLAKNKKYIVAQESIEFGFMYTLNMYNETIKACAEIKDHESMFSISLDLLKLADKREQEMTFSFNLNKVIPDKLDEIIDKYCEVFSEKIENFLIELLKQIIHTDSIDKAKYIMKVIDKYEKYSVREVIQNKVSLYEVMDILKRLNDINIDLSSIMIGQTISQKIVFNDVDFKNSIKMNDIIEGIIGNKNSPYYFLNKFKFFDNNFFEICLFLARKSKYSESINYLNLIQNEELKNSTTIKYIEIVLGNNDEEEAINFSQNQVFDNKILKTEIDCKISEYWHFKGDIDKSISCYRKILNYVTINDDISGLGIVYDSFLKSGITEIEQDFLISIKSSVFKLLEEYKLIIENNNYKTINSKIPIIFFLKASLLLRSKYKNEVKTLLERIDLLLKKECEDWMDEESIMQYFDILQKAYQKKYSDVLSILKKYEYLKKYNAFAYEMEEFIPFLIDVIFENSRDISSKIDIKLLLNIVISVNNYDEIKILLLAAKKLKDIGKLKAALYVSKYSLDLVSKSNNEITQPTEEITTQLYLILGECLIKLIDELDINFIRKIVELIDDIQIRSDLLIKIINKAYVSNKDDLVHQLKTIQRDIKFDSKFYEKIIYSLGYYNYPIDKISFSTMSNTQYEKSVCKSLYYLGMTNAGIYRKPKEDIHYGLKMIINESLFNKVEGFILSNNYSEAKKIIDKMYFSKSRIDSHFYLLLILKMKNCDILLQFELRNSIIEIVEMTKKQFLESNHSLDYWMSQYESIPKIIFDSENILDVLDINKYDIRKIDLDILYYYVSKANLMIGNTITAEKTLSRIQFSKIKLLCLLDHYNFYNNSNNYKNKNRKELIYKELKKIKIKYELNSEDDRCYWETEYVLLRTDLLFLTKDKLLEDLCEYYIKLSESSYTVGNETYYRNDDSYLNKYYFKNEVMKIIINDKSYCDIIAEILKVISNGNFFYRDLNNKYKMIGSKYQILDELIEIGLNVETMDCLIEHVLNENYNHILKNQIFYAITSNLDNVLEWFPEVFLKIVPYVSKDYYSLRNCLTWYSVHAKINSTKLQELNYNNSAKISNILPCNDIFKESSIDE